MASNPFEKLEQLRDKIPKATESSKPKAPTFSQANIESAFTPWEDRRGGTDFWEGMSERDALNTADGVHRGVQTGRFNINDVQEQLQLTRPEATSFVKYSNRGDRPRRSKISEFGVPHTAGQENMFSTLMTESGNKTESLASLTGDPEVTDLISTIKGKEKLVDVQNIMTRGRFVEDPTMTLDFLKNFRRRNSGIGAGMFDSADDNESFRSILKRITSQAERNEGRDSFGFGKMLQSGNFEEMDVGNPDFNMRNRRGDYAKDFLVGGIYDTDKVTNLTGKKTHGTYNPRFPEGGAYATDLEKLRSNILDLPKKDILGSDGQVFRGNDKSLSLRMPLKRVQELSGGNALGELLNNPVLKAAREFSSNPGFRMAGMGLAAVPILGDAADATTGTIDAVIKTGDQQVRGAGNAVAGLAGLGTLAAPAAAPVLGPISMGLGVGNMAADNAKERKQARSIGNSSKHERSGAFSHTADSPVSIGLPGTVQSETQRRRQARRSSSGKTPVGRPQTGKQWWEQGVDSVMNYFN